MRAYNKNQYDVYETNIAEFLNDLCEYHNISYRALANGNDAIRKQISLFVKKKKRNILLRDLTEIAALIEYDVLDILAYDHAKDYESMVKGYKHQAT
ncbi:hypothetical protein [Erysipelothrix aquatica]|uniref:hypothetical protein n=1 Tax=Erysipelothrix aquatica TaxID=2683714 RepID=UPI001357DF22|nr:hypothetical protein [Erysipelothrix aquatica]